MIDPPALAKHQYAYNVDIEPGCATPKRMTPRDALTRPKLRRNIRTNQGKACWGESVRSISQFFLGLIIAATVCGRLAQAQGDAVFLVTYVEAMPDTVAPATAFLKKYQNASSHEDGNVRIEALQELERPNRFAIVESWRDKAALDAHEQSAATTEFRDKLKAFQAAPYDERINSELYAEHSKNENLAGALYVVTHVDVIPPGKDECMAALKAMSVDTAADTGNISYEVLQQANRGNHFAVLEVWANRKALDGHATAAHTRAFRAKLVPIAGALYDERIYKAL